MSSFYDDSGVTTPYEASGLQSYAEANQDRGVTDPVDHQGPIVERVQIASLDCQRQFDRKDEKYPIQRTFYIATDQSIGALAVSQHEPLFMSPIHLKNGQHTLLSNDEQPQFWNAFSNANTGLAANRTAGDPVFIGIADACYDPSSRRKGQSNNGIIRVVFSGTCTALFNGHNPTTLHPGDEVFFWLPKGDPRDPRKITAECNKVNYENGFGDLCHGMVINKSKSGRQVNVLLDINKYQKRWFPEIQDDGNKSRVHWRLTNILSSDKPFAEAYKEELKQAPGDKFELKIAAKASVSSKTSVVQSPPIPSLLPLSNKKKGGIYTNAVDVQKLAPMVQSFVPGGAVAEFEDLMYDRIEEIKEYITSETRQAGFEDEKAKYEVPSDLQAELDFLKMYTNDIALRRKEINEQYKSMQSAKPPQFSQAHAERDETSNEVLESEEPLVVLKKSKRQRKVGS